MSKAIDDEAVLTLAHAQGHEWVDREVAKRIAAAATVAARFGMECVVYMGEEDIRRQKPNVFSMRLLGQKMSDEQWQSLLDVHLTAPFRILRAATPFLRAAAKKDAEDGREVFRKVVNVSSVAGLGGNAGQANYAAAKAGVVGLTKTLCKEWGRYKVNVNCVAFGLIQTRLTQPLSAGEARINVEGKEINVGIQPDFITMMEKQMIPLGRAGTPEEAADAVFLFCSPEADYISGQTIVCGGGLTW